MIIDGIATFDRNKIANGFNNFFTEICPELASSIPNTSEDFQNFISTQDKVFEESLPQDKEQEEACKSLKTISPWVLISRHRLYILFLKTSSV